MSLDCDTQLFDLPAVVDYVWRVATIVQQQASAAASQRCSNSSAEVFEPLRGEERQMDRFFFALRRRDFFSLSVMEAELCKRGESSHRPSLFLFFSMSQCIPA